MVQPRVGQNRYRWIGLRNLIGAVGVTVMSFAHAAESHILPSERTEIEALMTRVGRPSQEAIGEFREAGMNNARSYTLTSAERGKVQAMFASLPALNRHVLAEKLHRLAFVDGTPNEGAVTGLTSQAAAVGLYDITLRTSILRESLSTFLTNKERRVFVKDGSGITVSAKGSGADTLTYVMLDESSHVVDKVCGITTDPQSRFVIGIWTSQNDMIPTLASSAASNTYLRAGHRFESSEAAVLYDALMQTPFVSLYATTSAEEDFAELVAWYEIRKHGGNLVIELNDSRSRTTRRWKPLTSPSIQARFGYVDELLTSQASCRSVSWSDIALAVVLHFAE